LFQNDDKGKYFSWEEMNLICRPLFLPVPERQLGANDGSTPPESCVMLARLWRSQKNIFFKEKKQKNISL